MRVRMVWAALAALALPGAVLGQTTVSVSGVLKGGYEHLRIGNYCTSVAQCGLFPHTAGSRNSQHGVVDDSSRIIFRVREELGDGLAAIGQLDMRMSLDAGVLTGLGNNHVGLQSRSLGRLFFGRQDLHYFNTESELTVRGSLRADSISLLSFAGPGLVTGPLGTPVAGQTRIAQIATTSRTANVAHYTTPNWGGFTAIVAYSSNATGPEADLGATTRRGRAWNLNPNFAGKNFQVGYSYWNSRPDAPSIAIPAPDQRSDRLYGSYRWGGLKVGLAWDRSRLFDTVAGVQTSNRTAWSVPAQYTWGSHGVYAHYTRARDDEAPGFAGLASGARMIALSYAYDLSRRTSVALTYARISNDANAGYTPFTSALLGLGATPVLAGEDPRVWGLTLRHTF